MSGDTRVSRVRRFSPVLVGALVVLLVAGGLALWPSVRAATTGTSAGAEAQAPLPILQSGVRFRLVAEVDADPDPSKFTEFRYVVPGNRAVSITDVVLQNPAGDAGTIRIQIGDDVILQQSLSTFRDQQYDIPLQIRANQPVILAVSCQLPGPPEPAAGRCRPSASFFG